MHTLYLMSEDSFLATSTNVLLISMQLTLVACMWFVKFQNCVFLYNALLPPEGSYNMMYCHQKGHTILIPSEGSYNSVIPSEGSYNSDTITGVIQF